MIWSLWSLTKIIILGEKRHLLLEEDLRVEAVGTLERTLRLSPTRAKTGTKMVLIKGCTTCQGLRQIWHFLDHFAFSNIMFIWMEHKSKFQLAPDIVRRSEGRSRSVGCSPRPLFFSFGRSLEENLCFIWKNINWLNINWGHWTRKKISF